MMGVKLGPAGVPLSCKGEQSSKEWTILSLSDLRRWKQWCDYSTQHFEQYWQAGVLANKADFEMNIMATTLNY